MHGGNDQFLNANFRLSRQLPGIFSSVGPTAIPTTPSAWFTHKYPNQAEKWGTPIMELVYPSPSGIDRIVPAHPNIDFFAAILGGVLGLLITAVRTLF